MSKPPQEPPPISPTARGWRCRTAATDAVSPGVPGDSGSGTLESDRAAIGVTSVIYLAPYAAGNGLTDVGKALAYARDHIGRDYRLVNGTEPFDPDPLT